MPGVIPIYEAGDADGQLYIAMRYVDGIDLGELLRREGALEPARALALVGSARGGARRRARARAGPSRCQAVATRSSRGEGDARARLSVGLRAEQGGGGRRDAVGVGRVRGDGALHGARGDPRRGMPTPARTCTRSAACCSSASPARRPFAGPSEAAVIYGHLEEPPPRASDRRPGLPRALDAVLARALDKDPERRWASGAELMQAARAALAGRGAANRSGDPAPRGGRRRWACWRWRWQVSPCLPATRAAGRAWPR